MRGPHWGWSLDEQIRLQFGVAHLLCTRSNQKRKILQGCTCTDRITMLKSNQLTFSRWHNYRKNYLQIVRRQCCLGQNTFPPSRGGGGKCQLWQGWFKISEHMTFSLELSKLWLSFAFTVNFMSKCKLVNALGLTWFLSFHWVHMIALKMEIGH